MLGVLLREELVQKGLRFNFVAEQCFLPAQSFSLYMTGRMPMPKHKALLVCEKFGIDFKKLEEEAANAELEAR